VREAEDRALSVLREHRDALDRLVEELLAHETVDGATVLALVADVSTPSATVGSPT
jgi:cell division protease FtsH